MSSYFGCVMKMKRTLSLTQPLRNGHANAPWPKLMGKGLDVFASMAFDEANNSEALKKALLKRYQLTEEGFRTKFGESKPHNENIVVQYVARLRRYLTRWVELSDIEHSFNAVSDLML